MNSKHRKTLEIVFANLVAGNLDWSRIEALLLAVGCRVVEGSGSSVTFEFNGQRAYFHRPHPGKDGLRYRVIAARKFLEEIGVKP